MEYSFTHFKKWKVARQRPQSRGGTSMVSSEAKKWTPPNTGELKLNVDASFFPGANNFSIGMLIRDHTGVFVE